MVLPLAERAWYVLAERPLEAVRPAVPVSGGWARMVCPSVSNSSQHLSLPAHIALW